MRPGSVIGEQQHYLCALDEQLQRRADGGIACSTFDEADATSSQDMAFVRVASALHEEGRVSKGVVGGGAGGGGGGGVGAAGDGAGAAGQQRG